MTSSSSTGGWYAGGKQGSGCSNNTSKVQTSGGMALSSAELSRPAAGLADLMAGQGGQDTQLCTGLPPHNYAARDVCACCYTTCCEI